MTIIEASGKLFKWFSEHESFEIDRDFIKLVMVSDNEERDKTAVLCSLAEFEKSQMIGSQIINDKKHWVLRKAFSSYEQSVEIQSDLALAVSLALNEFCEAIEDDTDRCDPLNLSARDIQNLVLIYRHIQSKFVDDENK